MSTTCNTSMHCFCRLHTSGQWMCCGCGLFASNAQSAISNLQSAAALPGRAQASPELLELGAPASAIERICVENEEADEGRIWCRVCEKDDVTDMHAPECPIGKLRELLASADAAVQVRGASVVQEPSPLLKFACHFEKCASNPDAYPYHWRESNRAMCDCGLAPLMPLGVD